MLALTLIIMTMRTLVCFGFVLLWASLAIANSNQGWGGKDEQRSRSVPYGENSAVPPPQENQAQGLPPINLQDAQIPDDLKEKLKKFSGLLEGVDVEKVLGNQKDVIEKYRQLLQQNGASGLRDLGIDVEQAERLEGIVNHPGMDSYVDFVSDPDVSQGMIKVLEEGDRKLLLILELSLLAFMFVFRSWLYSRLEKGQFLSRVWIGVWTTVMYFGLAMVAIPVYALGDGYWQVLKAMYRAV